MEIGEQLGERMRCPPDPCGDTCQRRVGRQLVGPRKMAQELSALRGGPVQVVEKLAAREPFVRRRQHQAPQPRTAEGARRWVHRRTTVPFADDVGHESARSGRDNPCRPMISSDGECAKKCSSASDEALVPTPRSSSERPQRTVPPSSWTLRASSAVRPRLAMPGSRR